MMDRLLVAIDVALGLAAAVALVAALIFRPVCRRLREATS